MHDRPHLTYDTEILALIRLEHRVVVTVVRDDYVPAEKRRFHPIPPALRLKQIVHLNFTLQNIKILYP